MRSYIDRTYFTMTDMNIDERDLSTLCVNPSSPITIKFIKLFLERFTYNWAIYEDREIGVWEENPAPVAPSYEKITQWTTKFKNRYELTYDRYATILNAYETQKNNLLNKISSTQKTKYNDTPQEDGVGASDGYNSSITTNTTEIDPGEMITRLNNIEKNYNDIYYNWLNEFTFLFGEAINND